MPASLQKISVFDLHPHPMLEISDDMTIVAANPAALSAFGDESLLGKPCCQVIFGQPAPCAHRCLDRVRAESYASFHASGIQVGGQKEEHYLTIVPVDRDGSRSCIMWIHPIPAMVDHIRYARAIERSILGSRTIAEVLTHFRTFLLESTWGPAYRIRQYSVDDERRPTQLTCTWHDIAIEPQRPYKRNTRGAKIHRDGPQGPAEFHTIDLTCLVLVTPSSSDIDFFKANFQTHDVDQRTWVAKSEIIEGIRLYKVSTAEEIAPIFEDGELHCFLDIPFGAPGKIVGKMSVTPQGRTGRFSREELEEITTLLAVANAQIEHIRTRETERREVLLGTIHEVAQPAFMALTSIEYLRRQDREIGSRPDNDKMDFYAKKNIETAIRLVAFLNDAPRISRDRPCYHPVRARMIGGVLAPIVNMVRHEEYAKELNRRAMTLSSEHLGDLELSHGEGEHRVSFKLITAYDIFYDGSLENLRLYVNEYRLQEVFYNLISNASKYRVRINPFRLEIKLRRDTEFSGAERSLYSPFYVIDINDTGLGIDPDEAPRIFGLGIRGTAADRTKENFGTGRGLFVVREIMLSIGGDVFVQNCLNPTRFRLFIPAACREHSWPERLEDTRKKIEAVRTHLAGRMPPL